MITEHDKLKCVERELALRKQVYPRHVAQGRMTHREARHQIDVMQAIVDDYRNRNTEHPQEDLL